MHSDLHCHPLPPTATNCHALPLFPKNAFDEFAQGIGSRRTAKRTPEGDVHVRLRQRDVFAFSVSEVMNARKSY
jgi:hypothetical protein